MKQGLIAIGIVLGLSVTLTSAGRAEEQFQYVGVKKCRTCHKKELMGDQYGTWKDAEHAKAFETLASEEALEYAREKGIEGSPQEADECVKCHVTGHGVDGTLIKYELHPQDGVQCESCHGPGSAYRKKKIMSDPDKSAANGLVEPSEKLCVSCHSDESPAWDPKRYVLANGTSVGFDYEQATEKIAHPIPADVKGKYIELEKKLKAEKKARGEAVEEDEEED